MPTAISGANFLIAETGGVAIVESEGNRLRHVADQFVMNRASVEEARSLLGWLRAQGITAELVPLQSSVELAPVLGLADAIVDLVQSGKTLLAHHLVELTQLGKASARLVACRGLFLSEPERIGPLARGLTGLLRVPE